MCVNLLLLNKANYHVMMQGGQLNALTAHPTYNWATAFPFSPPASCRWLAAVSLLLPLNLVHIGNVAAETNGRAVLYLLLWSRSTTERQLVPPAAASALVAPLSSARAPDHPRLAAPSPGRDQRPRREQSRACHSQSGWGLVFLTTRPRTQPTEPAAD